MYGCVTAQAYSDFVIKFTKAQYTLICSIGFICVAHIYVA